MTHGNNGSIGLRRGTRSFSVSLSDAVCVFLHVMLYPVPFGIAGGGFSQHIHCKSVTLFELVRLFRMCVHDGSHSTGTIGHSDFRPCNFEFHMAGSPWT